MVDIIFEAHSTTVDNERHLSSGHADTQLSALGVKQSKELGKRYVNDNFDAIFTSDLQSAYNTAKIAFDGKFPIVKDKRLRECDYGDLTLHPSEKVEKEKIKRIETPFPNGESYRQTTQRMRGFLADLLKNYNGKRVMIIGHRATQYGLESLINNRSLEELVVEKFKWQPGWHYQLR